MKIKTTNLMGKYLDWAVRECLLENLTQPELGLLIHQVGYGHPVAKYSVDYEHGGPIMLREKINTNEIQRIPTVDGSPFISQWAADIRRAPGLPRISYQYGPTQLIAAMRCYVALVMGHEVTIPEDLR